MERGNDKRVEKSKEAKTRYIRSSEVMNVSISVVWHFLQLNTVIMLVTRIVSAIFFSDHIPAL